jgi:hypothetical protein
VTAAIEAPAHQVANRLDRPQVMGTQARALALGPGIADPDRLAGQRGIGGSLPHDGAAAGVSGSVDVNHARLPSPLSGLPCDRVGQPGTSIRPCRE